MGFDGEVAVFIRLIFVRVTVCLIIAVAVVVSILEADLHQAVHL